MKSLKELGLVKTAEVAAPTTAQQYNAYAVNLRERFGATNIGSGGFTGSAGYLKYRDTIMKQESSGNQFAVNKYTGAMGLYQFMPKTLRGLGFTGDFKEFMGSRDMQNEYMQKFTEQNAKALNINLGSLDPNGGQTLSWAHFGGVGGAKKMLAGNQNYGNTNFYGTSQYQYGNMTRRGMGG